MGVFECVVMSDVDVVRLCVVLVNVECECVVDVF